MPLEPNVTGIQDLNETWPLVTDLLPEANEHLQNIKKGIRGSFAHMAANGGIVTVTANELNALTGITSNVQTQLDAKPQSITWTKPAPVASGTGETLYQPQPNTRLLMESAPGDTLLIVELPLISASSDRDTLEFKVVNTPLAPNGFQLKTQGTDEMRVLRSDSSWGLSSFVIVQTDIRWPHFVCSFQTYFGRWVVRSMDCDVIAL